MTNHYGDSQGCTTESQIMVRLIPLIYALLVAYLLYDCYQYRREPFWYLVLLIPVWGVCLYIWRFKWHGSW